MKVWCLFYLHGDGFTYEDRHLVGVFTSKERAEAGESMLMDQHPPFDTAPEGGMYVDYALEEWELDELESVDCM